MEMSGLGELHHSEEGEYEAGGLISQSSQQCISYFHESKE